MGQKEKTGQFWSKSAECICPGLKGAIERSPNEGGRAAFKDGKNQGTAGKVYPLVSAMKRRSLREEDRQISSSPKMAGCRLKTIRRHGDTLHLYGGVSATTERKETLEAGAGGGRIMI